LNSASRAFCTKRCGGPSPPRQTLVNTSDKQFNTVHANTFHFYEELNAVIQAEPAGAFDPETVGLFAAIGIKRGKPFAPDARTRATGSSKNMAPKGRYLRTGNRD